MFQSSRTASGRLRLQISSAFSPSSASTIWKSRPSRIRRAIFRTTLESSTTRHVLIFGSHLLATGCELRGKRDLQRHVENAIDIEHDHEVTVEAMDAAGELGHAGIEIDGVFLAVLVGEPQHLADLVDQQA